jgi:hypothetical protein
MALQKRRSRFLVKFESGGIKMMTNHSNSVPKFAEGHESLEHFETLHKTLNETILSVKMTSKSHLAARPQNHSPEQLSSLRYLANCLMHLQEG